MKNINAHGRAIVQAGLDYLETHSDIKYTQVLLTNIFFERYKTKIHPSTFTYVKKGTEKTPDNYKRVAKCMKRFLHEQFSVVYDEDVAQFVPFQNLPQASKKALLKDIILSESSPVVATKSTLANDDTSEKLYRDTLEQPIGILGWLKRKVQFSTYLLESQFRYKLAFDFLEDIKYYVSPYGIQKTANDTAVDLREQIWKILKRREKRKKFYVLLGDSGTGKTTFLMNLCRQCLTNYQLRNKEVYLFLLSNSSIDVLEAIKQVKHKHQSILLLDAFDEDIRAQDNYEERLNAIINVAQQFDTVFISCRPQFFPKRSLEPQETNLPNPGTGAKHHRYEIFYISPFSDELIRKILKKKYPWWLGKKKQFDAGLRFLENFQDLKRRPLLIRFIEDLRNKKFTYLYEAYEEIVRRWAERERGVKGAAWLLDVSKQIANYMHDKKEYFLTPEELEVFSAELERKKMQQRSLLTRNYLDQYVFVHSSFMEYLLACYYFEKEKEVGDSSKVFRNLSDAQHFYEQLVFSKQTHHLLKNITGYYDSDLSGYQSDDLEKMKLKEIPSIRKIKIEETDFSEDKRFFEQLKIFKKLEVLEMINCAVNDISCIGIMPMLQKLNMSQNRIDNSVLGYFNSFKILEELSLSYNNITSITPLKLKHLWFLDIHSNPIQDFSALRQLPSLKVIHLTGDEKTDWSFLMNMEGLSSIKIYTQEALSLPLAITEILELRKCTIEVIIQHKIADY